VGVERSGEKYFPVYELAPFRIIVVEIGVFLAFFFTVFPYPTTSSEILRRDIGRQLRLLSNIYSLIRANMAVEACSRDSAVEIQRFNRVVEKAFFECNGLQRRCMQNFSVTTSELDLKCRFPKQLYADLLSGTERLLPFPLQG
jgi:hypothetical protein